MIWCIACWVFTFVALWCIVYYVYCYLFIHSIKTLDLSNLILVYRTMPEDEEKEEEEEVDDGGGTVLEE